MAKIKIFMKVQNSKPHLFDIIKSVLASFFGVQSDKNRQRDFQQGNPLHFIVVGLFLTVIFILLIVGIVKYILYSST